MKYLMILWAMLALSGCVSTQEMPLSQNMVRIDTRASGAFFTDDAVPATMIAAAKATLARGFTHFKFADAKLGQGSEVTGESLMFGQAWASSSVNRMPTSSSAATVVMFHENEPGAKGALEAATILAQYQPLAQ